MESINPRTRSQVSLDSARVLPASLQSRVLQRTLFYNASSAVALYAGREWLLRLDVGVFWVLMRVLACGGLGALVWAAWSGKTRIARRKTVEWSVLGVSSIALLMQQACLLVALLRLSPFKVIVLTHIYTIWPQALIANRPSRRLLVSGLAILLSFLSDAEYSSVNFRSMAIAYGALTLHAVSTLGYDHAQSVLSPSLGTDLALAASTLGAAVLGLPLYGFRRALIERMPPPSVPLSSLVAIPLLAYSLLVMSSSMTQAARNATPANVLIRTSYPCTLICAAITGIAAFSQYPTLSDAGVALLLSYGLHAGAAEAQAPSRAPMVRLLRSHMKTILSNPESRKIFYFLMLNMVYMLVQIVYGVWTNSLGLISDAIHMAFDCMAIGVGLFASVMATWDPNEQFTYGYGRIETLSGFANGVFLILISVFIVFEAVQRILEPPEMETSQLLLVSSLGLAVNLFGMFAMGGHHHGHSHSHSHSHGGSSHGHSHAPSPPALQSHAHTHSAEKGTAHAHSHNHESCEDDHHSHGDDNHSHSHSHEEDHHSHADGGHGHSHSHSHEEDEHDHSHGPSQNGHGHSHGHDDEDNHSHSHSHSHSDDHSHSHSPPHGHSDSHNHGMSSSSPDFAHVSSLDAGAAGANAKRPLQKRQFSGPALKIPDAHDSSLPRITREHDLAKPSPLAKTLLQHHHQNSIEPSPLTPAYSFTHDEHYEKHHAEEHGPNLHSHGHSHGHEGHSDNMRGVFLHVMADTLGSVGVIISTLLIQYYGWTGFDPIASLFIAILIVASVIPLVIDTGKILCLDASSRDADIQEALSELTTIPGVASFTSPRFWPKDSSTLVGSIHIQLEPSASSFDPTGPHSSVRTSYSNIDRVIERVDTVLKEQIRGLEELTIQVEGV